MAALITVGGVSAGAGPVDCATLQVLSTWDIQYREQERFPEPVRTVKKDLLVCSPKTGRSGLDTQARPQP